LSVCKSLITAVVPQLPRQSAAAIGRRILPDIFIEPRFGAESRKVKISVCSRPWFHPAFSALSLRFLPLGDAEEG
jgi:hypothetical protein